MAVFEDVPETVRDAVDEGVLVDDNVLVADGEAPEERVAELEGVLEVVPELEGVPEAVKDAVAEGVGDLEGVPEGDAEHHTPGKSVPASLALGPCPAQRGTTTTSPCAPAAPLALLPTPLR